MWGSAPTDSDVPQLLSGANDGMTGLDKARSSSRCVRAVPSVNDRSSSRGALAACTVLISGPSAAGKSTVGSLLAQRFERGVYLEGDWFRRAVVSGRADMTPDPSDEALRQLGLRYQLSAASTDRYRREGFGVVVEDVVAGTLLEGFVSLFTIQPVRLFVLMPSFAVVQEREAGRAGTGYHDWAAEDLYALFEHDTPRIGHWLDTSDASPAETADEIVRIASGLGAA